MDAAGRYGARNATRGQCQAICVELFNRELKISTLSIASRSQKTVQENAKCCAIKTTSRGLLLEGRLHYFDAQPEGLLHLEGWNVAKGKKLAPAKKLEKKQTLTVSY